MGQIQRNFPIYQNRPGHSVGVRKTVNRPYERFIGTIFCNCTAAPKAPLCKGRLWSGEISYRTHYTDRYIEVRPSAQHIGVYQIHFLHKQCKIVPSSGLYMFPFSQRITFKPAWLANFVKSAASKASQYISAFA